WFPALSRLGATTGGPPGLGMDEVGFTSRGCSTRTADRRQVGKVLVSSITDGSPPYLDWVRQQVAPQE
ncbi:MAG: hypothetical protein VX938_09790, partial [Myxococcota bacterium]|nr:hypothetical protein [Myxococcota bacterium]